MIAGAPAADHEDVKIRDGTFHGDYGGTSMVSLSPPPNYHLYISSPSAESAIPPPPPEVSFLTHLL